MKRKLALLLAGVMTATMLPMNLFAVSTNGLERTISPGKDNTLIVQPGTTGAPTGLAGVTGNSDIENWMVGSDFVIELKADTYVGERLELSLENADFFFRSDGSQTYGTFNTIPKIAPNADVALAFFTTTGAQTAGTVAVENDTTDMTGTTLAGKGTFDESKGALVSGGSQTVAPAVGTSKAYKAIYAPFMTSKGAVGTAATSPAYLLGLSAYDDAMATLVFNAVMPSGTKVRIPMPMFVEDPDVDVALTIEGTNTGVTPGRFLLMSSVSGGTATTIEGVNSGRASSTNPLELKPITVKETKLNTMDPSGQFTLTLSDNYEFVNKGTVALTGVRAGTVLTTMSGNQLTVSVAGLEHTSALAGVRLEGVKIKNTSAAHFGDVFMAVADVDGNELGITEQDNIKVATRTDYGVTLTANSSSDKIPQLVAGRYTPGTTAARDAKFKVLRFKIAETAVGSLWSNRDTKIVFPEGVIVADVNPYETTNNDNGAVVLAVDGDDPNTINVSNIVPKSNSKVSFVVEAWVTIRADFAGKDITATLSNAGIAQSLEPLVVATTIAPVSVDTKVTTITVGGQIQKVSDIVITENVAGALKKGKVVRVRVTDAYGSTDQALRFVSGTTKTIATGGDLKVDFSATGAVSSASLLAGGGNEIAMVVKTASSKASTLTLSNVQVKADRDLPETSGVPYKIYVYGDAVAENYSTVYADNDLGFDTLEASGYFADYIEVSGTAGVNAVAVPTKEFSLIAGATNYTIAGEVKEFTPDMSTFIDPTGTVMLSTRLVAEAFGYDALWDDATKTVTVADKNLNPIAMFPVGKTYYVKSGMNVPMQTVTGVPVSTVNKGGRVFVSLRQVANALGIENSKIVWDDSAKKVTLNPVAAK